MSLIPQRRDRVAMPSRRRFVTGAAATGALVGLGLPALSASAAGQIDNAGVLSGTDFDLTIGEMPINITGRRSTATAVNGSVPAPVLHWREGETVTLRVTNRLRSTSSIHWHGILLPFQMDGVPGLTFNGIQPGETFTYRFDVKQSGTYWYHSHSRFQEQTGLYGPIVVTPRGGERHRTDRDYVLMLSDWSDDDPEVVMANLKKMSDFYNFNELTAVDFAKDASRMGLQQALAKRKMWNRMRMSPTDLSDVTGHHYTYLINGASPDANWTALFKRGEKVRLRVINGSAQSIFDLRIPGLKMTVVAADGQDVDPVTVEEFRIAVAEIYDVIVEPTDDRAYTIFAQSIDREGYARATLAPRAGMQAEVPKPDRPQWLTMVDMMGSMAMGGDMAGMDHGDKPVAGMDHAAMGHGAMKMPAETDKPMSGMDHAAMGHGAMPAMADDKPMAPTPRAHHARTEYGPGVDMRVDMPRTNIDDPGIGLRDNGRKVLTYADLHTIGGPRGKRGPGRAVELHRTGVLAAVHQHWVSLGNMRQLLEWHAEKGAQTVSPAAANADAIAPPSIPT